jgi:hypothetical protein
MSRMLRLIALSLALGCGGSVAAPQPPAAPAASAELSPALAPLAWWLGAWSTDDGKSREHWVAAAGAIYGVSLQPGSFEVMIIDDGDAEGAADGTLRFYAMPAGAKVVEFRQRAIGSQVATFANDAHDFPKTITYRLEPSGLVATLGGGPEIQLKLARATVPAAPALEEADRAFAADTARRGLEGWVAAFDAQGGMMRKTGRVDRADVGALMKPVLDAGRLAWAPIASGQLGDLGFTVGKATFTPTAPGEPGWRSTYVSIWRRQADGGWKVLFDTGRPVHE